MRFKSSASAPRTKVKLQSQPRIGMGAHANSSSLQVRVKSTTWTLTHVCRCTLCPARALLSRLSETNNFSIKCIVILIYLRIPSEVQDYFTLCKADDFCPDFFVEPTVTTIARKLKFQWISAKNCWNFRAGFGHQFCQRVIEGNPCLLSLRRYSEFSSGCETFLCITIFI